MLKEKEEAIEKYESMIRKVKDTIEVKVNKIRKTEENDIQ